MRSEPSTNANHNLRIGERLRAARLAKGLTIARLANSSDLSQGFISQLERDGTNASVATLLRICEALEVSMGSLFEPSRKNLIRRSDRLRGNFGGYGIADFLLSPASQRYLQVIESRIEPNGRSGDEEHSFDADAELIYLLSGILEVSFGDQLYRLHPRDALTLSPRESHRWRNPSSKREAVVLWIITPAAL